MYSRINLFLIFVKIEKCLYSSKQCLINPSESLLLLMFFAANNISIAEENSAAENSLRTKQHLSGLNFFRLFFGIKNILFFFIITFLFNTELKAKNCLSFVPYGFNDFYVHLPQEALFCVKEEKKIISYKTDIYGGRIFSNDKNNEEIQIFGDSQVLGLDIEKIEDHYLSQLYKKNFIIYAAPNNGPFEVINFLNLNKEIIKKKIIINFNFSNDIYRIHNSWNPENFVALKDYELDEILDYPLKYKLIIFKNLLSNKNFTLRRYNNKKMQNLFLRTNKDQLTINLKNYFNSLDKLAENLDLDIDLIIVKPYWIYSKKKKFLFFEKEINEKVEKLICKSFNQTSRIQNIYISGANKKNLDMNDLTSDNRHYKSTIIQTVEKSKIC